MQAIIGDIQEAGWSVKVPRENEQISDQDLKNIFDKVDRNRDLLVNRMVTVDEYQLQESVFNNLIYIRSCVLHASSCVNNLKLMSRKYVEIFWYNWTQ